MPDPKIKRERCYVLQSRNSVNDRITYTYMCTTSKCEWLWMPFFCRSEKESRQREFRSSPEFTDINSEMCPPDTKPDRCRPSLFLDTNID